MIGQNEFYFSAGRERLSAEQVEAIEKQLAAIDARLVLVANVRPTPGGQLRSWVAAPPEFGDAEHREARRQINALILRVLP